MTSLLSKSHEPDSVVLKTESDIPKDSIATIRSCDIQDLKQD
jgi:hypothetical protein